MNMEQKIRADLYAVNRQKLLQLLLAHITLSPDLQVFIENKKWIFQASNLAISFFRQTRITRHWFEQYPTQITVTQFTIPLTNLVKYVRRLKQEIVFLQLGKNEIKVYGDLTRSVCTVDLLGFTKKIIEILPVYTVHNRIAECAVIALKSSFKAVAIFNDRLNMFVNTQKIAVSAKNFTECEGIIESIPIDKGVVTKNVFHFSVKDQLKYFLAPPLGITFSLFVYKKALLITECITPEHEEIQIMTTL